MIHRFFRWLEGLRPPFSDAPPGKPPATLLGFLSYYARPYLPLLVASSTLATIVAIIDVVLFAYVGTLVDLLATANRETLWQDHRGSLIGMSVLVLVVSPALKFLYQAVIEQGLMGNMPMRIRWQAHRYLLRQSISFYQNDFAGRVATKMMQTALGVRDSILRVTEVLVYVGVYFTTAIILFAASDLRLSAPMVAWLIGYIVTLRYFVPRLRDLSREQAEARSMVTGRVVDSYTNISTVKMFAHADREDQYAREGMDEFLDTVYRQMRLSTLLTTVLTCLNAGLLFGVGGLSIWLWQINSVSIGAIAFSLGLVLRLQGMSQWILWEVSGLFENIGVVQDGIETIARDREIEDDPQATQLHVPDGRIVFDDISFNYGKAGLTSEPGVIEHLSLTVAAGEKIGVVGRSGAGKSTLVNLLLRFHDLEGGHIQIDGQDIQRVSQDSLRSQIGMVTQDTSLLHRSVFDNIAYGCTDANQSQVTDAAIQAQADDFIASLSDMHGRTSYDAHVGERGVKLSGGQRQRIAIARVLLKNAPILILDEATSALDSEVEAAIQDSLYSLMEGKTVIAIAHRLSTIAAMDRLIVMDHGKIIEQGSHDTLIAQKGLYADLWSRQSGGFIAFDKVPATDHATRTEIQ